MRGRRNVAMRGRNRGLTRDPAHLAHTSNSFPLPATSLRKGRGRGRSERRRGSRIAVGAESTGATPGFHRPGRGGTSKGVMVSEWEDG